MTSNSLSTSISVVCAASVVDSVLVSGTVVFVNVGLPVVVSIVVLPFDGVVEVCNVGAPVVVDKGSFVVVNLSVVMAVIGTSEVSGFVVKECVVRVGVVMFSGIADVTTSDDGACVTWVVVLSSVVMECGASLPVVVCGTVVVFGGVGDSEVTFCVVTGMVVVIDVSCFSVGSWVMRGVVTDGLWVMVGDVTEDRVVIPSIVGVMVVTGSVLRATNQ